MVPYIVWNYCFAWQIKRVTSFALGAGWPSLFVLESQPIFGSVPSTTLLFGQMTSQKSDGIKWHASWYSNAVTPTQVVPHRVHLPSDSQMRKLCGGDLAKLASGWLPAQAERAMTAAAQSDMLTYNASSPYHVSPIPARGHGCTHLSDEVTD